MKRCLSILLLSAGLCATTAVLAQSTDVALAEALYREGRSLMDAKRYDEACQKFAESQRLDPATGTLLNLASCNEARGKTATAWVQFNEALLSARRDQRDDRVRFATERIAVLEPKLSRLEIVVPSEAKLEGLDVRIDGTQIGPAVYGVASPIDPGKHTVSATAPGYRSWSVDVELGANADSKTVTVPALQALPKSERGPDAGQPGSAPGGPDGGPDRLVTERPVPTSVYVLGATTAALAIGAVVTGSFYLDRKATYNELNQPESGASDQAREDARDTARLWGTANVVLAGAALVGAAGTIYLYVTRPEVTTRAASVSPWVSGDGAGVAFSAPLF